MNNINMNKTNTHFFEQLYEDYQQDIFRFAFWLCGHTDEAKDITAETFLRMWTAKSDLQAQTVKGYLLTIARNIYLQGRRKHKEQVELDPELVDPAPNTENIVGDHSELNRVLTKLRALPEIDRTVLFMKAYEGLSYGEISQLLKLSIPSLKVKVHRARMKLVESETRGTHL
ncbi:MAG: RNA polymerase sigma factor [Psychrosphaera sp.]|nr:RNA polymerase sigma factor [Psychrosphaera sp.]